MGCVVKNNLFLSFEVHFLFAEEYCSRKLVDAIFSYATKGGVEILMRSEYLVQVIENKIII